MAVGWLMYAPPRTLSPKRLRLCCMPCAGVAPGAVKPTAPTAFPRALVAAFSLALCPRGSSSSSFAAAAAASAVPAACAASEPAAASADTAVTSARCQTGPHSGRSPPIVGLRSVPHHTPLRSHLAPGPGPPWLNALVRSTWPALPVQAGPAPVPCTPAQPLVGASPAVCGLSAQRAASPPPRHTRILNPTRLGTSLLRSDTMVSGRWRSVARWVR